MMGGQNIPNYLYSPSTVVTRTTRTGRFHVGLEWEKMVLCGTALSRASNQVVRLVDATPAALAAMVTDVTQSDRKVAPTVDPVTL